MKTLIFLTYLSLISYAGCLNVLVYSPAFAASHTNFMAHIADTLSDAGHNVTFLVPIADEARQKQLGVKRTKDVVLVQQDEKMKKISVAADDHMDYFWRPKVQSSNIHELFAWFSATIIETCANLMRNTQAYEEMKKRNFDIAIIEPMTVCGLGYAHSLGIRKTILVSSCTHFDFMVPLVGEPEEPSFVPALGSQVGDVMDIFERYENFKFADNTKECVYKQFDEEAKIYQTHLGKDTPSWKELFATASLYFTNSNPFLDFPRATIQKTIPIGGITIDMEKIRSEKLSAKYEQVLTKRSKTMLISFGSMVKSYQMPVEWRTSILNAIRSLPNVTFIWKYETDDLEWAYGVENIHFEKWVPQTALLADSRVTAFLAHGGMGSANELAFTGKPAVMVPILGDQARNSLMLERHKGVIVIKKHDLVDFELVRRSLHAILYDESYAKNAKRLAAILENQPAQPKDLVVKYTEFVAEYGPFPQMDPYGRQLSFVTRTFLDIYAIFALAYISAISLGLYLPLRIYYYFLKPNQKSKTS